MSTTARPVPQAPEAGQDYQSTYTDETDRPSRRRSLARRPWVQTVVPWVTSLGVHAAIIVGALVLLWSGVLNVFIPAVLQQQVNVPTTELATDDIGAVPNVGSIDDATTSNAQLDPVEQTSNPLPQGEADMVQSLATVTGGAAESASAMTGITGMGEAADLLGGGGGQGSDLFGEPGGQQGFMGIDIGRPGDGGAVYRIVFVCDASGSMVGEHQILLNNELRNAIDSLSPEQSFAVLYFRSGDEVVASASRELTPATRRFKQQAFEFVDRVTPAGRTNPLPAIEQAFAMRPELIFFLTDGASDSTVPMPAIEEAFARLNRDGSVMVNTIQFIQPDPVSEQMLRNVANASGGVYRRVTRDDL